MTSAASTTSSNTVELAPSYWVPLGMLAIALLVAWFNLWVALPVALFGLFLTYQAATLKLRFTPTALEVARGDQPPFKSFPYTEWKNWRIYWQPVPILFYFNEVKNFHFLPILFDPNQLETCLTERCCRID